MMANKCLECGCTCKNCISSDHDVHLHVEIENLKQKLFERENHIVTMETNFLNEANKFPNGEVSALREELLIWQDKYKRLYDAHRRVQRVNQGLEDKLLKLVDTCETDKNTLTKDVATLSHKLAEANYCIKKLTEDNERYKTDVSLAIQFLQCKQTNFVSQKFDTLPTEVQSQVSAYMSSKRKPDEKKSPPEVKSIKVPIPTFPPTAMVYSVPKAPNPNVEVDEVEAACADIVNAAIMAKVLEERQKERTVKHCDTCSCAKGIKIINHTTHHNIGTQTGDYKEMLCLRCNDSVQRTTTGMKIVRTADAIAKAKIVPTYVIDSTEILTTNNIVKVQPNNFLINVKSQSNSNHSSLLDLVKSKELESSSTNAQKVEHHHLCDKSSPLSYEVEVAGETSECEKMFDTMSAKNSSSENLRGPRYCSMRLQSGTRNILLDNAHNNIAPVLYTRSHKVKYEEAPKTHDSSNNKSPQNSDHRINSLSSDNSTQNQQRVVEWINNMGNDMSSSDNSRSDSLKNLPIKVDGVDQVKYAEMEKNVKMFLFGKSEYWKTVEKGKLKYQNFRDADNSNSSTSEQKKTHTETEI